MRLYHLRQKEIINVCTCRSLGCPIDIEFDEKSGRMTALIVAASGHFCNFFLRDNEYVIPWECICQIGDEIILVKIEEETCKRKKELPDIYR